MRLRSILICLLTSLLVLSACSGQEVWKGDQRSTKGNQKKKPDPMLTFKAATSLEGMLTEGPGKYANSPNLFSVNGVTLAAKATDKIKKFPKNLTAKQAYNRLIYLLAKDYESAIKLLKQYDPKIPLSSQRQADKEVDKLNVNVVILIDAGPSTLKKINSEETHFEYMKEKIKETFEKIEPKDTVVQLHNINYNYAIRAYSGKVKKFTPLVHSDKIEQKIIPALDEIQPGGAGSLTDALEQTKKELIKHNKINDLNQVYVISHGKDGLDQSAVTKAKELLYSEAQAQVHTIGFQMKDPKAKKLLQSTAFQGLGDYQETDDYIDFHDQSNNSGGDFKLREYKDILKYTWKEVMTNRKKNQIDQISKIYMEEKILLENAVAFVDIKQKEKDLLQRKIDDRISRIKGYISGKLVKLKTN